MTQGSRIGQILADLGAISPEDRDRAGALQPPEPTRLASRLLGIGAAAEADLVRGLAVQKGVPGVDIGRTVIDLAPLALVPRQLAEENLFLCLGYEADRLHIAMANPEDRRLLDELAFVTGHEVVAHVALQQVLRAAIRDAYAAAGRGETFWRGAAAIPGGAGMQVATILAEAGGETEPEEELLSVTVELEDEPDAPVPVVAGDGQRILIVDDEEEIRNLLTRALAREGYRIETAGRGLEALQKIKSFGPDLVVLDAMLPEVHGFEICRKIRNSKRFGHVPVVMISAVYRGWRYAQDVKDVYGATDFIEKPFRLAEVARRVALALHGAEPNPEASTQARDRATRAYRRGIGMLKVGKVDGAIQAFQEGIAADPFAGALHFSLGRALQVKGDVFGAITAYERAVELRPELFPALRSLAALYEQKGFRRKAVETWERALPIAPDDDSRQLARRNLLALLEGPASRPVFELQREPEAS